MLDATWHGVDLVYILVKFGGVVAGARNAKRADNGDAAASEDFKWTSIRFVDDKGSAALENLDFSLTADGCVQLQAKPLTEFVVIDDFACQ